MTDVQVIYPFDNSGGSGSDPAPAAQALHLPTNDFVNSPLKFAGALSADECAKIVELGQSLVLESGEMVNPRQDYRKASISWIWRKAEHDWLFERIAGLAQQVNRFYKFECAGFMLSLIHI